VRANAYETEENIWEDMTAVVWESEPVALSEITGESGLMKANDINDSGQIIGTAFSQDLGQYAFLWKPEIKVQIDIKPGGEPNCINKKCFPEIGFRLPA
jgi:probable HAF family extracellular repeat protein